MKTSLVSSAVSLASIKADRPQQLKSVTVYWRGRKMVLMQRPQRRLSVLLCRMLRRSMQSLFGTLIGTLANKGKRAIGTAALATGALASMSAYAGITDITLPVNGTVQSGTAAISTVGNQMTVTQATDKAIIDWQSFSIGSKAGVNFIQNNANSVALNRVTGNDPSLIMGSLTANGKLFLVNAAGILVGKNAKIDVAGFVASTLNISNADFLAGKMNFAADEGKHIGNVKNKGEITVHDGGSVYLIGANVENDGIITAPNGEVLLAAGRTVKLIDTTLPGVSIDVGGIAGKVTNLGRIMASAGTVGIGAALIDNSGTINASSVTKEGGRIFLRASQDLTTTSTSMINADGTVGGNVVLYADHSANIDGDVSALGNVDGNGGKGGYVDTSGKQQLSVMYTPRIGAGGEWYIDPSNVDIVSSYSAGGLLGQILGLIGGVISGGGTHSEILGTTITNLLNVGTSVSVVTGTTGSPGGDVGDITVGAGVSIIKTGVAGPATLSLNAAHNITIADNVTIGDTGVTGHGMHLAMVAGYSEATPGTIVATKTGLISVSNATINVGNGFEAHAASYQMTGGHLISSGAFEMDAALTTGVGADIAISNSGGTAASLHNVTLNGGSTLNVNNSSVTLDTITLVGAGTSVTSSASTLTFGTTVLNSGTALTATNSGVTLGATTANNASLTFNNSTAALGATSLDSAGSLTVQNASHVTMNDAVTGTGTLNLGANSADTTASLNAGANAINLAALHQKAGALSGTNALTVNGVVDQTGGSINFHDVALTQSSGALSVGKVTASNNLTLTAAAGAISQFDAVTANNVIATATGGITLDNASNSIAHFTATNAGDNDMALRTVSAVSLGAINNAGTHNLTVNAGGAVTQTGIITAKNMAVTAAGGITLNLANQVEDLSATNSATGHIAFTSNAGAGLTLEQMTNTATGGNITVVATGPLSLNGAITTPNQVSLTSSSTIVQATGINGIVAASLIATAHGGMNFSSGANRVASFVATNYNNGAITLINNHGLTSGAGLDLGNVKQLTPTEGLHDVTITNAGTITASGQIDSGNGAVTVESEFGNVGLNTVNAGSMNITASMGSITQTGAFTTGSLQATALNDITLNNTGNSIGTFTGSAEGEIGVTSIGSLSVGYAGITGRNISLTSLVSGGENDDIRIMGGIVATGTDRTDGIVTLVSAGRIQEYENSGITTGTLNVTASGDIGLNDYNQIGTFSGTSTYGSIGLFNDGDLKLGNLNSHQGATQITTSGNLTVSAGTEIKAQQINLTTQQPMQTESEGGGEGNGNGGDGKPDPVIVNIILNGKLTTSNGLGVFLDSAGGVTQATGTGTGISTNALDIKTHNGITLNSGGNSVDNFTAFNGYRNEIEPIAPSVDSNATGDISLVNNSTTLTLGGTVKNKTANGNVSVRNTGDIIGVPVQNQGDGSLINGTFANNNVTLTSTTGNVQLAKITSINLDVNAGGWIHQDNLNADILTVSGTMNATANTGIMLDNNSNQSSSGNFPYLNHIANLTATNNGSGDISVINVSDTGVSNKLISMSNSGGNIRVENYGALETVGHVNAPASSVTLLTHSPLTIGAGGISAGNGVSLAAGDGTSSTDGLVVNGAIQTVSGSLTFLGATVYMNGPPPIGPSPPHYPGPVPPIFGPGYVVSAPPDVNPPVTPPVIPPTNTIDHELVVTQTTPDGNVLVTPTTTTTLTHAGDQTVGGNSGEFGGSSNSNDDDGKGKTATKSNKPLPVCS